MDLHALQEACGLNPYRDLPMHVSDILLECARECARLSSQSRDKRVGLALFEVSARLFSAALGDAELATDDSLAAPRPALHVVSVAGE
jgi:hypothetical protein